MRVLRDREPLLLPNCPPGAWLAPPCTRFPCCKPRVRALWDNRRPCSSPRACRPGPGPAGWPHTRGQARVPPHGPTAPSNAALLGPWAAAPTHAGRRSLALARPCPSPALRAASSARGTQWDTGGAPRHVWPRGRRWRRCAGLRVPPFPPLPPRTDRPCLPTRRHLPLPQPLLPRGHRPTRDDAGGAAHDVQGTAGAAGRPPG